MELGDVICENCSVVNGIITESICDKCMTLQKPPVILRILLQRKQYHWHTQISTKINPGIEIPSEYLYNFTQDTEDVTYNLVYLNDHGGNSMSPSNYLYDTLYFNTGIWWYCDDDKITKLREIPYNVYSVAPYPTSGKKLKNYDEMF